MLDIASIVKKLPFDIAALALELGKGIALEFSDICDGKNTDKKAMKALRRRKKPVTRKFAVLVYNGLSTQQHSVTDILENLQSKRNERNEKPAKKRRMEINGNGNDDSDDDDDGNSEDEIVDVEEQNDISIKGQSEQWDSEDEIVVDVEEQNDIVNVEGQNEIVNVAEQNEQNEGP